MKFSSKVPNPIGKVILKFQGQTHLVAMSNDTMKWTTRQNAIHRCSLEKKLE